MKDSYVESKFPRYFVFGSSSDGRVDIASEQDDTVATVSPEHAEKLIADRDAVVQKLIDMATAFQAAAPEAFRKFWYGDP